MSHWVMIMMQLSLCCSFITPVMKDNKSKFVAFLFCTSMIPFASYMFLLYNGSQPNTISSYGMILMSLVLFLWMPTIYASYQRSYWNKFAFYTMSISLLFFLLYKVFSSQSLLTFFIFFELSLIPIMAILFIGGSSSKKTEAGLYMFAFTSSSAFLFLSFLVLSSLSQHGMNYFVLISTNTLNSPLGGVEGYFSVSKLIYNLATVVMLVKSPLFFLHMWLPKAHVESPVFASMILASLLLKTGGYGYLVLIMSYFGVMASSDYSVCGLMLMAILAAVSCSTQVDMKMLIAYSSVNHMSVMLCGIFLGLSSSALGSVILMIGHGVISSVLFFLASTSYVQTSTRSSFFSLVLGKSNINMASWLMMTLVNAGLPPFLLFMGEALILKSILMFPLLTFIFLINYILIGYYSCLLLIKLLLSKFPNNVGSLMSVGLTPYVCNTVVFMHFLVLINMTICYPWLS